MLARLTLVLAVTVLVVTAAALVSGRDAGNDRRTPTVVEHPVAVPETARIVFVSRVMPQPSAHERRLSAMLEAGAMPVQPTAAEVVTDSDCAPDERMVSRCRNVMRLADGREIVLRHPHDMTKIPCLAPGEQVRLIPVAV